MREELGLDRLARTLGDLRGEEWVRSREDWLRNIFRMMDIGAEHQYSAEQRHGIRLADATAYRPLIEFCIGLSTNQFVRNGTQRWLARRMVRGRMPEEQRTNTAYGRHNSDWHHRMTPALPRLRAEIAAMYANGELRRLIDVERAERLLDQWPEQPAA